jgi:hypothetical protein
VVLTKKITPISLALSASTRSDQHVRHALHGDAYARDGYANGNGDAIGNAHSRCDTRYARYGVVQLPPRQVRARHAGTRWVGDGSTRVVPAG